IAVSCADECTIFGERTFFDLPAAGAGFLGFTNVATKATLCGQCHARPQAEWRRTAHAAAWGDLQASGGARGLCEDCHTVGPLGNEAPASSGWAGTRDARYHDVQCESCHGPGETHVAKPDASQPLASLAVGVDLSSGCGECHRGTHHPFVEDWSRSRHATVVDFAAAREDCRSCHSGQGALDAWGVRGPYVERDAASPLPITCGVCHDPHDATNVHQLRFPVATTSIQEHLCARCHDRRSVPDPSSAHGLAPHAPEAALLAGDAGWFPPGLDFDRGDIVGTHGTGANPELCAGCHVSRFTVTDPSSGSFVTEATGHLFEALPCVDAAGTPVGGDCPITTTARSFQACAASGGCHASEGAAAGALSAASARIEAAAADLIAMLAQVDPNLEAAGGEIDAGSSTFTVAEGAFFNWNLATFGGSVTGSAVHNPFLSEALLLASVQAVSDEYGIPIP
ncbi:MAG: cytochrome c3 family protein, partial [Gemmatimonadota bacterium]